MCMCILSQLNVSSPGSQHVCALYNVASRDQTFAEEANEPQQNHICCTTKGACVVSDMLLSVGPWHRRRRLQRVPGKRGSNIMWCWDT